MKNFIHLTATILFFTFCWSCSDQPKQEEFEGNFGSRDLEFRNPETKNLSPYAIFGDSSFVLMTEAERTGKHSLVIPDMGSNQKFSKFEIELKTGKVQAFDTEGKIIEEFLLPPEVLTRFVQIDPRSEKYSGWSPYNYVLGNPIRNIDPNGDTVKVVGSESALNRFEGVVNRGLGGFYETSIAVNGAVSLNATGKEGSMTTEQEAFFKLMSLAIDNEKTTNLNIYDHTDKKSRRIPIGDASMQAVDIQDIENFGGFPSKVVNLKTAI